MVDLGLCKLKFQVHCVISHRARGFVLGRKFSRFLSARENAFSNLAIFSKNKIPWNFKI